MRSMVCPGVRVGDLVRRPDQIGDERMPGGHTVIEDANRFLELSRLAEVVDLGPKPVGRIDQRPERRTDALNHRQLEELGQRLRVDAYPDHRGLGASVKGDFLPAEDLEHPSDFVQATKDLVSIGCRPNGGIDQQGAFDDGEICWDAGPAPILHAVRLDGVNEVEEATERSPATFLIRSGRVPIEVVPQGRRFRVARQHHVLPVEGVAK
ncbi:MAG: hypothetical protein M3N28_04680 [Actinomycetota bacterium]|nr:hypothetical protein [Actinomycetota bacterium]